MKKEKNKKENRFDRCKHLYVDVFGHPYCTCDILDMKKCEHFLPSEEYLDMKQQIEAQKAIYGDNPDNPFKVPSTYKCTKYDQYADANGHLPQAMRPRFDGPAQAVTVSDPE